MKIGEPEEPPERQKAIEEARFCLNAFWWALLLGIFHTVARLAFGDSFLDDLSVRVSILIFQCCFIVTGLWLGIRACRRVTRVGKQGILTRAIIGIVLNSLVLIYVSAILLYILGVIHGVIHGAGMLF